MDNTIMSAAEIAGMDEVLAVAPAAMWADPEKLAKWVAVPLAARFGVEEATVQAAAAKYIRILARNADAAGEEEEFALPRLRYNAAMIEADAIASASCGD